MEIPLTPLEFARRTRRLHGAREAVVEGELRLSYEEFFAQCDRWSAVLQNDLAVGRGERVATIAPNTHAQLESFYAVPQLGAVLVPIKLQADRAGLCVHHQPFGRGGGLRDRRLPGRDRRGALRTAGCAPLRGLRRRAGRQGWLDYESALSQTAAGFAAPEIDERDLLTINYTSGTTARPKGVMITHQNAAMNMIGTLLHLPVAVGERYLWTLPMSHANGWTYTWIVTAAAGTHLCLPKVEPAQVFRLIREERARLLCAAPTVLISLANAPAEPRGEVPSGVRVVTAGAPPAAATIERLEASSAGR
ncbi:MAG TPA: AMP-binding protein [Candidatus Limnocylindrales bacterium]|nr:AMP-binding protein [Candidatus Limnocylindrales bacterium]